MLLAGGWTPGAGSSTPGAAASPIRLTISLPPGDEVTDTQYLPLAISPDGSRIVYVGLRDGSRQLFLRNLADVDSVLLAGTEGGRMPFFSPDGQWIGFFTNTQLKKLAVASGAVQTIIADFRRAAGRRVVPGWDDLLRAAQRRAVVESRGRWRHSC